MDDDDDDDDNNNRRQYKFGIPIYRPVDTLKRP
jgi:hypothetical protein